MARARTMGTSAPLIMPNLEKTVFLNKIDDRLTDYTKNIISGFTGLLYAAYFDSLEVFEKLFDFEYLKGTVFEINGYITANTKTTRFMIPINTDCLSICLLRGSRRCMEFILK